MSRGNGEGSIYSRVQRRTRKDGTVVEKTIFCAAVSLDFGKRKVVYGDTREEVAAELVRMLGARQGGLPLPGVRLKTGQYLEQWLEETVRPSRKPLTCERYASIVSNHLVPVIGKVPLARLGPEHVQKVQARMQTRGLSPATILAMRTTLGAALTQAERWGLIARNPVRLVARPRALAKEPRVLSPEETAAFVEAARGDEMEYLFITMLATGLRSGEARGLRWSDVGPHTLEVRQQVVELKDERASTRRRRPRLRSFDEPKSRHGRRSVPLTDVAIAALAAQKQRPLHVSGLCFPEALVSRTMRDHFARIATRAGISDATPHTLRHSTATFLLAAGVPDRVVQDILGHGSGAVTRLYQHVTPSMLTDAGTALDGLLHRLLHREIASIGN